MFNLIKWPHETAGKIVKLSGSPANFRPLWLLCCGSEPALSARGSSGYRLCVPGQNQPPLGGKSLSAPRSDVLGAFSAIMSLTLYSEFAETSKSI